MKTSAGWIVGLAAGAVVCAASAAQAEPVALADAEMDGVTAGFFGDDLMPLDSFVDLGPVEAWEGSGSTGHSVWRQTDTTFVSNDGATTTRVVTTYAYTVEN